MKKYRWIFVIGIMWVYALTYIDRVNLSVGASTIMKEFGFSATEFGIVMGAMIPGYALLNLFGGVLVDRKSPMKVLSWCIALWSLTLAWFCSISTITWMVINRFIFGAAEGVSPPATQKLGVKWMLPNERGLLVGLGGGSCLLGVALGAPFCATILAYYDWRTLFYILTAFGFVSLVIVNLLMKDTPREHKWVSKEELELIEGTLENERKVKGAEAGDKSNKQDFINLLKNPYVWLGCLGYATVYMLWWANLSWLPGYFVKEKGMTVFKSGWLAAVPYLVGAIGMITGGWITDKLLKRKRIPYLIICQLVGPPIVFLAIGADSTAGMILGFSVSMFFTAGALSQFWPFFMDILPTKVVGSAVGLGNFVGAIAAFFAPVIMGRVYDVTHSFYWGFGALAGVVFLGVIISIPMLTKELSLHKAAKEYKHA